MGYSHTFYAVDLDRLRSIPGSKDLSLYEQIKAKDDSLNDGELDALRRIVMGECQQTRGHECLYGYALKAICGHIGEMVGGDVAAVRDHPYKSKLVANGAPIDIPYTRADFPQIGYLSNAELAREYKLATETPPKVKRTLQGFILRKLFGNLLMGREMDPDDMAADMQEYALTLKECMDRNCSLVSFRH